jgi:hypothetical protein
MINLIMISLIIINRHNKFMIKQTININTTRMNNKNNISNKISITIKKKTMIIILTHSKISNKNKANLIINKNKIKMSSNITSKRKV